MENILNMATSEQEFETPLDADKPEVELPLLAIRDTVVFPRMLTPLFCSIATGSKQDSFVTMFTL